MSGEECKSEVGSRRCRRGRPRLDHTSFRVVRLLATRTTETDRPEELLNPVRPFLPSGFQPELIRNRVHEVGSRADDSD